MKTFPSHMRNKFKCDEHEVGAKNWKILVTTASFPQDAGKFVARQFRQYLFPGKSAATRYISRSGFFHRRPSKKRAQVFNSRLNKNCSELGQNCFFRFWLFFVSNRIVEEGIFGNFNRVHENLSRLWWSLLIVILNCTFSGKRKTAKCYATVECSRWFSASTRFYHWLKFILERCTHRFSLDR